MFEHMTFNQIMTNALARVPNDVDKREGAIIYDAIAPTAMELAETYATMDRVLRLTFADSSDGDFLARRVGEFGVEKKLASAAIRQLRVINTRGELMSVPIGAVFFYEEINYTVVEEVELGIYKARANQVGTVGNKYFGDVLPMTQIQGLGRATMEDVLVPGEDDESDESLYQKYLDFIRNIAFGGNRADYKRKIMAIDGVGGVRLYRAHQGGGTVKVVICGADFNPATQELLDIVQEEIDPIPYTGDGYGTAPIGHEVQVSSVNQTEISFETTLVLNDITIGQIESTVRKIIEQYFSEMRATWPLLNEGNGNSSITVRLLQIEARILEIEGVLDVIDSKLNGATDNAVIENSLPMLAQVILNE